MENEIQTPRRYKICEAARRHGLTEFALRKAVRERQVEFFKVGKRYEFTDAAVLTFLDRAKVLPTVGQPMRAFAGDAA